MVCLESRKDKPPSEFSSVALWFNRCANEDIATEAYGTNIPEKKVIHRNVSSLANDLDNLTLKTKEDQDELLRVTHMRHKLGFKTL